MTERDLTTKKLEAYRKENPDVRITFLNHSFFHPHNNSYVEVLFFKNRLGIAYTLDLTRDLLEQEAESMLTYLLNTKAELRAFAKKDPEKFAALEDELMNYFLEDFSRTDVEFDMQLSLVKI